MLCGMNHSNSPFYTLLPTLHLDSSHIKDSMAQISKVKTSPFSDPPNMASENDHNHIDNSGKSRTQHMHCGTIFRWPIHRRLSFRRRRLPLIRLGGGKKPRQGSFLARLFKKSVKMRSLKHKCSCILKKLKNYCRSLVKEVIETGGSFQQRMLLDSAFALPVMGLSFTSLSDNGSEAAPAVITR